MRGEDGRQRAMLVVINPEQRVPKGHPLRRIKALADAALAQLSPGSMRCIAPWDGRRFRPSGC
jgi:hypothetical protein